MNTTKITYSIESLLSLRPPKNELHDSPPQFITLSDCCVGFIGPIYKYKNDNFNKIWYKDNNYNNNNNNNKNYNNNNKNYNNNNNNNKNYNNKYNNKYDNNKYERKDKYNKNKNKNNFKNQSKSVDIIKKHDIKAFNDLVGLVNKISDKNFDSLIEKMKPISLEIDDSKLVDYLFGRISKEQTFIDIYIRIIKSLSTSMSSLTEMCIKHTNATDFNDNKAEGIGRIYKHDLISKETIKEIILCLVEKIKETPSTISNSDILCRLLITTQIKIPELKSIESQLLESILLQICKNGNDTSSYLNLINTLNITKTTIFNKVKIIMGAKFDKKTLENLMKFIPCILTTVQIKTLITILQKEIQTNIQNENLQILNLKTSLLCFILKNENRLNLNEYIPFLVHENVTSKLESRVKFLIEDVKDNAKSAKKK